MKRARDKRREKKKKRGTFIPRLFFYHFLYTHLTVSVILNGTFVPREREIRAAEERLLEKDVPRSADEFEKLVRSSPNSSFVWIKYMAFVLSLADVENARSIAERY